MVLNPQSKTSSYLLSNEGPLAKAIPGFNPRESQIELAAAVEDTLDANKVLIAEAGTGTGKTFAYLIPALMSGEKVVISTGTKNLQDQLFLRDLPVIRQHLPLKVRIALLKGRGNYLCQHRLMSNEIDRQFVSKEMVAEYQHIQTWADRTRFGDIAELDNIPDDSPVLPLVTSNADNCIGAECNYYDECFLVKARRRAQEADVIVINHHLFFSDCAIKDKGFGELLPEYNAIIFDEAHLLAEIAGQYFGTHCSSRQFNELVSDIHTAASEIANDMPDLIAEMNELKLRLHDVRLHFGSDPKRGSWTDLTRNVLLQRSIEQLHLQIEKVTEQLEIFSGRSQSLENCHERVQQLHLNLKLLTQPAPADQIHWYETYRKSFAIHHTPMNIAKIFKELVYRTQRSWIFTSATLTVANQFDHFIRTMGLYQSETLQLDSPFDYQKQALLYCPRHMPEPNHRDFLTTLLSRAIPLIEACQGRTFFLFTSHRALQAAAEILQENISYPILVQGTRSKTQLLQDFTQIKHAVLLGTYSFWEGVDVRGETLSCVIIDKLPFASPADPILKARMHAMKQQNQDPFYQYQLPHSVISMRQGIGRLIRDGSDKGVIMIADPRLTTRRYGQAFIESFPNIPITRDPQQVLSFIDSLALASENQDMPQEA